MDNYSAAEISKPVIIGLQTYTTLLLVLGTIGNVLLLCTLLYKRLKSPTLKSPTDIAPHNRIGQYSITNAGGTAAGVHQTLHPTRRPLSTADKLLSLLTLSDLCCLWVLVLRYLISLFTYEDIRTSNEFVCKVHTFLSMVCSNLSTALLCVFSVQRAVRIRWPFASRTWLTSKRLTIALYASVVLIILKHLPALYLFEIHPIDARWKCDIEGFSDDIRQPYYYVEFVTHCVIGYSILILANIFLCVSLSCKKNISVTATFKNTLKFDSHLNQPATAGQGANTARVLLFFSSFQLITSVPFFVLIELNDQFDLNLVPKSRKMITYYILLLAMFTNNAINYFVFLGISSRFRSDSRGFFQAILERIHRKRQSS